MTQYRAAAPISRRTFLAGAAAAAALAPAAGRAAGPDLVAVPAYDLADFVSVQTHLNWRDTVWSNPAWRKMLGDLGVRYTRSALGNRLARDHLKALYEDYGIRSSATFNAASDDGTFDLERTASTLEFIKDKVGAEKVHAIEGPNEYTHKHKHGDWAARLRAYQEHLYTAVKGDEALRGMDVLAPTIWKRIIEDYEAIGDLDAFADYGNLHLYNGGRRPSRFNRDERDEPIDVAIREAQIVVPGKPICVTETGFNAAITEAPTRWTVPPEVAAKYTLRNIAELFLRRDRVKRMNVYSLIDDEHKDDHFGLLDASLTPRPAYLALRNFMRLVNDKQAAPKASLACAIGAENDDIRWQLLAKSDGRFLLMLWHDAESYSRKERRAMEVAPSPVSIDFGGKVSSLRVFMPTLAEEPQQELSTAASLKLELPDHLTIVEIVP